MSYKIPFNKPYLTGNETKYITEAVASGKISGDGQFTRKCQQFFETEFDIKKALLTTSCTDALEMSAILSEIKQGDEVIMPSYTFVSTANAFILRGAKIVFCDSREDHPGMDETLLEGLITEKTKAIVPVHYAGVACNMELIMQIAKKHNLLVIEDAAQAIDSYFIDKKGNKKPLGSIGHLAAFSFHETKNIISGEGGLLAINDLSYKGRAEIIWEKGTNRSAFFRGEIDKYGWVDVGSSFLPSEVTAAFLWAQLENLERIQSKRKQIWEYYDQNISNSDYKKPVIPNYATNNAHMYYLVCNSLEDRNHLIKRLKEKEVWSVFHYQSLHQSEFYLKNNIRVNLPLTDRYSDCLVRLPLFYDLTEKDLELVVSIING